MQYDVTRRLAWLGFDLAVTVICAVVLINAMS